MVKRITHLGVNPTFYIPTIILASVGAHKQSYENRLKIYSKQRLEKSFADWRVLSSRV